MEAVDPEARTPVTVRCPICKKKVPFESPDMPFCSERCRLIDLGNWASEKYVIPSPMEPSDIADEESEMPPPDRRQ